MVFILGPPRTGTSITYYAMREIFQLPGAGESHVFPIMQKLIHEFYLYAVQHAGKPDILASALDTNAMKTHLFQYVRQIYQQAYGAGGWVDKTPGAAAITGVTLIQEAFPGARVLVMRRTGVEVVSSFQSKFGGTFAEACAGWALCMEGILKVRQMKAPFLEIDQFELANDPYRTSQRMTTFLGRPDKEVELARFFEDHRTDVLSHHDWRKRLTIKDTDWEPDEQQLFRTVCGPMMQAFGYPM
jgi:hypothetical protein